MNETEVCRLVSEVFCGKLDQSAFERFLANLLKTYREDYRKYDASTVPEAYRNTVKEYASLGSFTDTKKTSIALLIVQLTDDKQLDRARTRQRDFIADYLRNSGMHAALVAFLVPHRAAWRLSLVKLDHSWAVEGGKTKLREELTPAKRWSFAVSTESRNHTVKKRFAKLLREPILVPTLDELVQVVSVELVTEEFYAEIQKAFFALCGGSLNIKKTKNYSEKVVREIEQFCAAVGAKTARSQNALDITAVLTVPNRTAVADRKIFQDFSVRLLGRLIFCWFLRMKQHQNGAPLISPSILSSIACSAHRNYYHQVIEPLFFETLNSEIPRSCPFPDDLKEDFNRIPFLNGGLFEPQQDDFYQQEMTAKLSPRHAARILDVWFQKLFEILELYNFTIDENSKLDTDVSIDPEILGRIFENLLAEINPETGESARKSSGSFYTPRPIVDYMVEESLLAYLRSKFPSHQRKHISQDDFLSFVQAEDTSVSDFVGKYPSKRLICAVPHFAEQGFSEMIVAPVFWKNLREVRQQWASGDYGRCLE